MIERERERERVGDKDPEIEIGGERAESAYGSVIARQMIFSPRRHCGAIRS